MIFRKSFLFISLISVFLLQSTFISHAFAENNEKSIILTVWFEKDGEKYYYSKRKSDMRGSRTITMYRYGSAEPLASLTIPGHGELEGLVKFSIPEDGTYIFRSYPLTYGVYAGELTIKMSEKDNIIAERFFLKPVKKKTIKGNLTTDTDMPLYPAKISGMRNGSSKGMYSSETDENGNFSIKVFSEYDEELKVTSFYLKEKEISIPLTKEILAQDKSEWIVPGKKLSVEVEVFFDDGNEIKPYTLDLAKEIDGNVYHLLLDLYPERCAKIEGNIACFYELTPAYKYSFIGARLIGNKPGVWSSEKSYPIIDGDRSFQIEENSPSLKLKVVVGNLKKKTCSGTVTSSKGDPISKAKISFKHKHLFKNRWKYYSWETDTEGNFEIELPEGEYEVYIHTPEYDERLRTEATVKKDENWEFKLQDPAAIKKKKALTIILAIFFGIAIFIIIIGILTRTKER